MRILKNSLLSGIFLALLTLFPTLVAAQSNGLGITPRRELTVEAGKTVNDTLYINNLSTTQPLKMNVKVIDFKASNETGSPQLDLRTNAPLTAWSLKPFIKIADHVELAPGKSAFVPYTITIPAGQGAGSYYSAVQFMADNSSDKQVTLAASGVSLVFARVPGVAKESLQLQKFGAFVPTSDKSSGSYGSFYLTTPPQQFAYLLKNSGNIAEAPAGSILVKNIFGKNVKVIEDANAYHALALRDQTRRFDVCYTDAKTGEGVLTGKCSKVNLAPGYYTASLTLLYGQNGSTSNEIHATAGFWYLPVWFVILVIVVIAALALGGWLLYKRLTRNRKKRR